MRATWPDLELKRHRPVAPRAERQAMSFGMNVDNHHTSPLGRGLCLRIAQVEEQHITHYELLADPHVSWMNRRVMHDCNGA